MNFVVKTILRSRHGSMFVHLPLRFFYNALQKGATIDAYQEGKWKVAYIIFAILGGLAVMTVLPFKLEGKPLFFEDVQFGNVMFSLFLCFIASFCYLVRYGFKHRDDIVISDDFGKLLRTRFFLNIGEWVLSSQKEDASIFKKRLGNIHADAIMSGTNMDELQYFQFKTNLFISFIFVSSMFMSGISNKVMIWWVWLGLIVAYLFILIQFGLIFGYSNKEHITEDGQIEYPKPPKPKWTASQVGTFTVLCSLLLGGVKYIYDDREALWAQVQNLF